MQYPARKPWILVFMWVPSDTNLQAHPSWLQHTHKDTGSAAQQCALSHHRSCSDSPRIQIWCRYMAHERKIMTHGLFLTWAALLCLKKTAWVGFRGQITSTWALQPHGFPIEHCTIAMISVTRFFWQWLFTLAFMKIILTYAAKSWKTGSRTQIEDFKEGNTKG